MRNLAYRESQLADQGYLDELARKIADAVCSAYATRAEACCGAANGFEDKVAFTRQFHMKNGLTYTHPGKGNPNIVSRAGAIDPQVGVIGVWSPQGRMMGCVVNYTCHATTNPGSGLEASANWIYYMERVIRGAMGADVPVVFLQGAVGNVTQVDNQSSSKSICRKPSVRGSPRAIAAFRAVSSKAAPASHGLNHSEYKGLHQTI